MSAEAAGEPRKSATTHEPTNKEIAVSIAVAVLEGKGVIEDPDDRLLKVLGHLYEKYPECRVAVTFTNDPLHNLYAQQPGELLAAAFELEREGHWEREEAQRWSCPCGALFGLYPFDDHYVHFFTLTADGLFDQAVADCPRCARTLKDVREQHADGQLGFAF